MKNTNNMSDESAAVVTRVESSFTERTLNYWNTLKRCNNSSNMDFEYSASWRLWHSFNQMEQLEIIKEFQSALNLLPEKHSDITYLLHCGIFRRTHQDQTNDLPILKELLGQLSQKAFKSYGIVSDKNILVLLLDIEALASHDCMRYVTIMCPTDQFTASLERCE